MRTPCIKCIWSHALFVLHMALMGVEAYKYRVEFDFDTLRVRTSSRVVHWLVPSSNKHCTKWNLSVPTVQNKEDLKVSKIKSKCVSISWIFQPSSYSKFNFHFISICSQTQITFISILFLNFLNFPTKFLFQV